TARETNSEVGLQYNRGRCYDPHSGKWTSQDPLGFEAGDANLYRYVLNGPTLWVDPSGQDKEVNSDNLSWDDFKKVKEGKYDSETAYSYFKAVEPGKPDTSDSRN